MFPAEVGQVAKDMLSLVVTSGTGQAAQVGEEPIWGKTGTTENYGDAWFVGGNDELTVAVWVGYADQVQAMEYEHAGGPVAGGTFPAEIFADFMSSWVEMREAREAARGDNDVEEESDGSVAPAAPVDPDGVPDAEQVVPTTPSEADEEAAPESDPAPDDPADPPPVDTPPPAESAPPPQTPPTEGGGTGGGGVGADGGG